MASELSAPLVRKAERKLPRHLRSGVRPTWSFPLARSIFALLALGIAGLGFRILLVEDPSGGQPVVEVAINSTKGINPLANTLSGKGFSAGPEFPAGEQGDMPATPDAVRRDVLLSTSDGTPNAEGLVPDLIEDTQYGSIPRMGATGNTPFTAYSRPATLFEAGQGKPMIAIVVTGLGLNETGTLDAIAKLPEDISLAFAPYGKTLQNSVGAARQEGHEVFLEVPLEPFDYPQNDPGPETLLAGQPARANLDKLFWLMARFGGYAGIINHMGARFTSSGADFNPLMEELGTRGLGYIDDGSSNRSLARQLARTNKVPFAQGDMTLDTDPAPEPIMAALKALEAKARQNGAAVGVISALPVSIQTVSEWVRSLEGKDVLLVPASALMKS
jgi:uncharacterized protein